VNNAGAMCAGPLIDQSLDYVKYLFDANTFGALRVAKAVVPAMAKRKSGTIVNIGSIVGEIPTPWNGMYCASKAALQSISEVLAMECKPFNISVMHVAPGAIKSNIAANESSRFSLPADSLYSAYLPNILERIHTSQSKKSTPTSEFARGVVSQAMKRKPPGYMALGTYTFLFKIFKWLPRSWVFWILWRMYSKKLD